MKSLPYNKLYKIERNISLQNIDSSLSVISSNANKLNLKSCSPSCQLLSKFSQNEQKRAISGAGKFSKSVQSLQLCELCHIVRVQQNIDSIFGAGWNSRPTVKVDFYFKPVTCYRYFIIAADLVQIQSRQLQSGWEKMKLKIAQRKRICALYFHMIKCPKTNLF